MSAKKLRKEWPFLWFCIMVVSSKLTSLAWYLPYRNQISDTIGSLRTNYKLQSKPFITESIRRAISLVFGLGLTKQIPKDKPTKLCEIGRSLYEQWRKKNSSAWLLSDYISVCMILNLCESRAYYPKYHDMDGKLTHFVGKHIQMSVFIFWMKGKSISTMRSWPNKYDYKWLLGKWLWAYSMTEKCVR